MSRLYYEPLGNEPFWFASYADVCFFDEKAGFLRVEVRVKFPKYGSYIVCAFWVDPNVVAINCNNWFKLPMPFRCARFKYKNKYLEPHKTFLDYGFRAPRFVLSLDCEGRPFLVNIMVADNVSAYTSQYVLPYEIKQEIDELLGHDLKCDAWELQNGESENLIQQFSKLKGELNESYGWIADLVENLFQMIYWFSRSEGPADYAALVHLGIRLFFKESVSVNVQALLNVQVVELQSFEDDVHEVRHIFELTTSSLDSPLVRKMYDLYTYLLAQGFLAKFGLELSKEEYHVLSSVATGKYSSGVGLFRHIIDTAIFICEKICDYRATGELSTFVHSSESYWQWAKEADRLVNLGPFVGNLAAQGTDSFTFHADLDEAIEKGRIIERHSQKTNGFPSAVLSKKLQSLEFLKANEFSRRSAQQTRKAPMGVFLYGPSSVGKSTIMKMMFTYYGKLHGLGVTDNYFYVRNGSDPFFSGYDSSKWCICLDDVGYLLPQKVQGIDVTLNEIIAIGNQISFCPNQAAIEDKGKTPILARLLMASSNTPDMNVREYFSCPLAVSRRLPYVVEVEVKPEYRAENGCFLDGHKVPPITDGFPNYWNFKVKKIVPTKHINRDVAAFETVATFEDVNLFLQNFGKYSQEFDVDQEKSMTCARAMQDLNVCSICALPGNSCDCLQNGVTVYWWRMCFALLISILEWCAKWSLQFTWLRRWVYYSARVKFIMYLYAWLTSYMSTEFNAHFYALISHVRVRKSMLLALQAFATVGAAITLFSCMKSVATHAVSKKRDQHDEFVTQGNVYSTTEVNLPKDQNSNVWFNKDVSLCHFDVPRASASNAHLSDDEIREIFSPNCVALLIHGCTNGRNFHTGGFFLRGQFLFFNAHCVMDSRITIKIVEGRDVGVSPNTEVTLNRSDIYILQSKDLACVQIMSVPPKKDILKYCAQHSLPVSRILSICRQVDGSIRTRDVRGVDFVAEMHIPHFTTAVPLYFGRSIESTAKGDCGSLAIAVTPRGPVIVGIHTVGHGTTNGFMLYTCDELKSMCEKALVVPVLSGEGSPKLGLQGGEAMTEPHRKSVFRWIPHGVGRFYGSLPGFVPSPVSKVTTTPLCDTMCTHFGCSVDFGRPAMCGWEPWRINVDDMVHPTFNYDRGRMLKARNMYLDEILRELPDGWQKELVVLSDYAAVNGVAGVKFIDCMNMNTSMGYPYNTGKKKFLVPAPRDDTPDGVDFLPEIWEEARRIEGLYLEGKRAFPVFMSHLKDEPRPLQKCLDKKTRLFTGSSVPASLVARKYFLSFTRLVQCNNLVFEALPGVVVQSEEWTRIHDFLCAFDEEHHLAGDYSHYDKNMMADLILYAFWIIIQLHREAGFCDEDIRIMWGVATDTAYPVVKILSDIVMFSNVNPSGHVLTVIINSLVNSILMRYAYLDIAEEEHIVSLPSFRERVHLVTYGDDNESGVHESCSWYNHTRVQHVFEKIGIVYTMADKASASRAYVRFDEVSFLKRKWVWNPDLEVYFAPLDEKSIQKSLTVWIPSDTLDDECHMVAVISGACNEFFFYGKERFEKERAFFKSIIMQEPYARYVQPSTLPKWDDLVERFWRASGKDPTSSPGFGRSGRTQKLSANTTILAQNVHEQELYPGAQIQDISEDNGFASEMNPLMLELQSEDIDPESAPVPPPDDGADTTVHDTVTFIDNDVGFSVDMPGGANNVAMVDSTEDLSLGNFLARPTLIDTMTWTTSDTYLKNTIKPWYLFMNSVPIKKKLDNYAFLRGRLHLKVIINGTPFQYGAMRACYNPLLGWTASKIRSAPINSVPLGISYSQMPGFYIYPQSNSGGEMECPFFLHKNWLDITSGAEVQNMGTLFFYIFAALQVAVTGGSSAVTVRTYAWMTDVELMGSTTKLALQADEYGTGPVSAPATAVASIASKVSSIPVIGRFARATEIGARAVAGIAQLFGYTNVPVISNVQAYHPMNAPMLASSQIGVPVQKLSLDPKQELSIDPAPHGLGSEDELALAGLVTRQSYLTTTVWGTSDSAGTLLQAVRITPELFDSQPISNTVPATVGYRVYHTPMSYVSAMFKHWRGDIVIRVKIVCTKFHKGRLKISYDPRWDISTTDPPENVVYTEILDIGEKDDVEFVIPYHQDLGWLALQHTNTPNHSQSAGLTSRLGIDNGTLTIRVLNTLTAPTSGGVSILVFAYGTKTLEYANPTGYIGTGYIPPSFFALQAKDVTSMATEQVVMGGPSRPSPDRYAMNFGEAVASLRNLIHRYVVFETTPSCWGGIPALAIIQKFFRRMPYTPGFDPAQSAAFSGANKIVAASGTAPYNYTSMPHLAYVAGLFLGYRGSVNYVCTPSYELLNAVSDIRVRRVTEAPANTAARTWNAYSWSATDTASSKFNTLNRLYGWEDGNAGMAITSVLTNNSLMFSIPDYNNRNFSLVDPSFYYAGSALDGTDAQGAMYQASLKASSINDPGMQNTSLQTEVAAGADFTCLFFLCCPTLDVATVSVTPL